MSAEPRHEHVADVAQRVRAMLPYGLAARHGIIMPRHKTECPVVYPERGHHEAVATLRGYELHLAVYGRRLMACRGLYEQVLWLLLRVYAAASAAYYHILYIHRLKRMCVLRHSIGALIYAERHAVRVVCMPFLYISSAYGGSSLSPDVRTFVLRNEQLVALLHAERLVPCVDMRQGIVDTGLVGGVNVRLHEVVYNLRTGI